MNFPLKIMITTQIKNLLHLKSSYLFLFYLVISLLSISQVNAQATGTPDSMEDELASIEASKSAYLTHKMGLNPEQAQKFWPVYNEFNGKRKTIRGKMRALITGFNLQTSSEDEAKNQVKKMLQYREEEIGLEKEYADRFLKVINAKQLVIFYQSNREFNRKLLSEGMKHRRGGRKHHGGGRGMKEESLED